MIRIQIELTESQIKEVFESADIRFSKRKMQELIKELDSTEMEIKESLEDTLMEALEGLVTELWEK